MTYVYGSFSSGNCLILITRVLPGKTILLPKVAGSLPAHWQSDYWTCSNKWAECNQLAAISENVAPGIQKRTPFMRQFVYRRKTYNYEYKNLEFVIKNAVAHR